MKCVRLLLCLAALACAALLTACGPSNTVHLYPVKPQATTMPSPTATTITVANFADERTDRSLGQRRDSSYFTTMDQPGDWVGRAVADAIAAKGFQTNYAATAKEASKSAPYLVTGSVKSINIKETSSTSFETTIIVKYKVAHQGKTLVLETLNASQRRTTLPSSSAIEELLQDTLWDVVSSLADKVASAVH